MTHVAITSGNIRSNPIQRYRPVRARIARLASIPGFSIGQEVDPAKRTKAVRRVNRQSYMNIWAREMNAHRKWTIGKSVEIPISIPPGWTLVYWHVVQSHEGLRKVSPARYFVVAKCRADDGTLVAIISCHAISKPRFARGVTHAAFRVAKWNEYHSDAKALVTKLHAEDYTVLIGGDWNKNAVPPFHPQQRELVHSGLDHIWVIPAAGKIIKNLHVQRIARNVAMDHPIVGAAFDLQEA